MARSGKKKAGRGRKKAGNQAGLQTGIMTGDTGEFAFQQQPVDMLGALLGRTGAVNPSDTTEYGLWKQAGMTQALMNQYNTALTRNKALSYPDFLRQRYGTQVGGGGGLVGPRGHRHRTARTPFSAGGLGPTGGLASQYEMSDYEVENQQGFRAYDRARQGDYRGMSAQAERMAREGAGDVESRFRAYQATTPWQDWDDFIHGISTPKPVGYDEPTSYRASVGGGKKKQRPGGGRGGKRR